MTILAIVVAYLMGVLLGAVIVRHHLRDAGWHPEGQECIDYTTSNYAPNQVYRVMR